MSFIVPIYNVEKYVADCLNSLLSQDIKKDAYEIICIDDGSTDNSLNIINDFAKENVNIRVFHKENGGVSSARNLGIEKSEGKYIWFVDGDDCIKSDCLKQISELINKYTPDSIFIQFDIADEEYSFIKTEREKLKYTIKETGSSGNVWSAIINSKIIKENGISFDDGIKYGEDTLFMYYVYLYSVKNVVKTDNKLYIYRQRSGSAMHSRTPEDVAKHTDDLIYMAQTYRNLCAGKTIVNKEKIKNTKTRQYWATEGALTILPQSSLEYDATMRRLKREKLYPYPMLWNKVFNTKGIKQKAAQFVKLFFRFEPLYKIYYKNAKKQTPKR